MMDFLKQVRETNHTRILRWRGEDNRSGLEWAAALCGEAGEAANAAKKIKRRLSGETRMRQKLFLVAAFLAPFILLALAFAFAPKLDPSMIP